MDEYTKCLIYKGCYDGFCQKLVPDAEAIIEARVDDVDAMLSAGSRFLIVVVDAMYEAASEIYRPGDNIDALCATAVDQMSIARLSHIADRAIHPLPSRLH